jgi:peptidoglycan LD-endopeptidase LytH
MTRMLFSKVAGGFILLAMLLGGCSAFRTINRSPPGRDQYANSLIKDERITPDMMRTWLAAGEPLLHDSIFVPLPFRETGYFPLADAQARFYRFDVKAGQVLTLTAAIKTKGKPRIFIDLFSLRDASWKILKQTDSLKLTYEFDKPESCLVRIQPEMMSNIYYSVTLSTVPALIIPVMGATNKSIQSFYDDTREVDGKKRKHEGLDIFAPKGTFVISPTDGVVSRVTTNSLGGKVIFVNDPKRGYDYYFAHLDSQIVKPGVKVRQGDVLGTVGNTGNARYTPSHLHFGVFKTNISTDPIAYIRTMERLQNELAPDTSFRSTVFRVSQKTTELRTGPEKKLKSRETLAKDVYLKIIAQSSDWYRVMTATDREGFVEKKTIAPAAKGNIIVFAKPARLLSAARTDAISLGIVTDRAEALAIYKTFRYVRTSSNQFGWIDLAQASLNLK